MIQTKEELFLAELGINTKEEFILAYGAKIKITDLLKKYEKQLTLTDVSGMLILTPKDAELFLNEVMNPKKANEALKKAMLKFITR